MTYTGLKYDKIDSDMLLSSMYNTQAKQYYETIIMRIGPSKWNLKLIQIVPSHSLYKLGLPVQPKGNPNPKEVTTVYMSSVLTTILLYWKAN